MPSVPCIRSIVIDSLEETGLAAGRSLFIFYSKEFKGSKKRHVDWRISRQAALKKHTNISVQLQNIKISQGKDTVDIKFTQTFKSEEYSDIGVKELIWEKNEIDWKIIKETWVPHKKTA